ncbi:MAG: FtsQ-type POTRA domain-containing protein [Clostridia bacterium]|nr:FtsQ-type POTRA domain-containing protein [Clostridia bacterium]
MKTKTLITTSIIICILLFLIILNSTVFCVKNININFLSTKVNVTQTEETILTNCISKKDYTNIFFVNKEKIKTNIQTKYPYIRVINIESVFPNTLNIHLIERQNFYSVKTSSGYYICDNVLGVTEKLQAFSSTPLNPIVLEGVKIKNTITVGMEIESNQAKAIENLSHCLMEWETDINLLQGNICQITLDYLKENQIMISMFNGTTILVENFTNNLSNKLNYAFSYYDKNQIQSGTIKIVEASNLTTLIYENN